MNAPLQGSLSAEELRRYEQRLRAQLASHARVVEGIEQEVLDPSGAEDGQEEDESIEETALASDIVVLETEDELLVELNEALERIAAGTFGICENCGAPIERERLDLVPWTRLCERCARALDPGARS